MKIWLWMSIATSKSFNLKALHTPESYQKPALAALMRTGNGRSLLSFHHDALPSFALHWAFTGIPNSRSSHGYTSDSFSYPSRSER